AQQLAHFGGRHAWRGIGKLFEDGLGRVEGVDLVLREIRHTHVHAQVTRTALEEQHAGQDLEEGRLARPVWTDERHLLAPFEGQGQAVIDGVLSVALDDPDLADNNSTAQVRLREPERY